VSEIKIHFADVGRRVGDDDRARVTGKLGSYLFKVAKLVEGAKAVEVGWSTGAGRPSLGPTDVLVYVVKDPDHGAIKANGGSVAIAKASDKVLGLTQVMQGTGLSEVYWDRLQFWQELAGAAFHEACHNKAQQGNELHAGQNGILVAAPVYGLPPSDKNLEFYAKFALKEIKQVIVDQSKF